MAALLTGAIAGGLVFTLLQMIVGLTFPPAGLPPQPPNMLPWLVLANVLMAGVLSWIARGSRLHGIRLALLLLVATLFIGEASSLIEAVFFKVMTLSAVLSIVPNTLIPACLLTLFIVWVTRTWHAPAVPAPAPPLPWGRLLGLGALGTVFYLVCYFAAGLLVLPYVKSFYEAKGLMPAPGMVLGVELLIRGPMFVIAIAAIVLNTPAPRLRRALVAAVAMSMIGGVVPLIVPNAFFTEAVRWAHFVEVVSSNFVFGAVVGWLMSPARAILPAPAAVQGSVAAQQAH